MFPPRRLLLSSLLLLATACEKLACSSSPSASEPSAPRQSMGFIEGRVRLVGPLPALAPLHTSPSVVAHCGETVPDTSLSVGKEGELAHVVVSLAEGALLPGEPDAPAPPAVLEQRRCLFSPPVLAARIGSLLEVRNADALLHNAHVLAGSPQPVINVALPIEGSRVRQTLPEAPGVLQVRCDLHPWMLAVIRTFEHPWFTTTDAEGRFRLQVPEGTHSVLLWHPRLPGARRSVFVHAGETVRLDYSWPVEALRPPPHMHPSAP
ncbi:MAG TPA: carboxypeptidase regulatory-like domain-containing protein, partial [Myxococcaceae bacterium]|nr:carboxypeptidase regulatory-like domain-containing protein [Myxococcaceae bacterium]